MYQVSSLESTVTGRSREVVFAGDGVRLAGQIDYPRTSSPAQGFPLLFILPHAGCNTREAYDHYAQLGTRSGYAVFRWDKRGTGRSGSGGRGSTTQDALNAYSTALDQPQVNPNQVVILAQGEGTALLGSAFKRFAHIRAPHGAVLVSSMLDERDILAIQTPTLVVVSQRDWRPWQKYAKAACDAHNTTYPYGASFYVTLDADQNLMSLRAGEPVFNGIAADTIADWLKSLWRLSKSA